jgi:hypothetical protein
MAASDSQKPNCRQRARRTWANASAKVGRAFWYQALRRKAPCQAGWRWTIKATSENKANRTGVARAVATSFHWRWPSIPR